MVLLNEQASVYVSAIFTERDTKRRGRYEKVDVDTGGGMKEGGEKEEQQQ